jgi:hypothetical protein
MYFLFSADIYLFCDFDIYRNITILRWKQIGRILITIAGMRIIL